MLFEEILGFHRVLSEARNEQIIPKFKLVINDQTRKIIDRNFLVATRTNEIKSSVGLFKLDGYDGSSIEEIPLKGSLMKPEKTSCVLKKQDIKVTHADSKNQDEDGLESSFSNFLQVEIVND